MAVARRATCAPRAARRSAASRRTASVVCAAKAEGPVSTRRAAVLGVAAGALLAAPRPAEAIFGIGGPGAEERYVDETTKIIAQTRLTLGLAKDDPSKADEIMKERRLTNDWVARYRRDDRFSGKPSYSNTYTALNAVSGHYNNFGTKYPLPEKRKARVLKELEDAELYLKRGR